MQNTHLKGAKAMCKAMEVKNNPDGTATATVGSETETFDNFDLAVAWATKKLYPAEGESNGD